MKCRTQAHGFYIYQLIFEDNFVVFKEFFFQKILSFIPMVSIQEGGYDSVSQYGHSQSEKKLGLGDKYYCSIKVHTLEAQNQNQLKSPLSELTS